MKIIDTHQHLWDLERFSYSWCQHIPALHRSFCLDEYQQAVQGANLYKSVYVEADVDEPFMLEETRYILELAEQENSIEGVVACGRPENKDFPAYLELITGHPKLKGIRRVLHTQPDSLAESQTFIENLRLLEPHGLSFDLCVLARQLPVAINLVRQCPGVFFILDHCGNPLVKERVLEPWQSYLEEMALLPNVACKISGLVTQADHDNWTVEDLRPFVNHVIECFGWERVMFGSDWPVCTLAASFQRWLDALVSLTNNESVANREKLFQKNAERIYRLEEGD